MKRSRRFIAIAAVLSMVFAMLSTGASALSNTSPIDYNDRELEYNTSLIRTNAGLVWVNSDTVSTNNASGTIHHNSSGAKVEENHGRIGSDTNYSNMYGSAGNFGSVTYNYGVVDLNDSAAWIYYNYGTVSNQNYGMILDNYEGGYINVNAGLIRYNSGEISNNAIGGTLQVNEGAVTGANTGTILNNRGTVKRNGVDYFYMVDQTGVIEYNQGTVELNDIYSIVNNNSGSIGANKGYVRNYPGGRVTDNIDDGRVYNYGGTVINNSASHYIRADLDIPCGSVEYGEGFSSDNGIDCWLKEGASGTAVITPDEGYGIAITVGSGITSAAKNSDGSWAVTVGGLHANTDSGELGISAAPLPDYYTVTVVTVEGEDNIEVSVPRGENFFSAMDSAGVYSALSGMENDDRIFRDLATRPLSGFADEDEFYTDAYELLDINVNSDMTVYACFYRKIRNVSLTIERPTAGSVVTIDEEYHQSILPKVTPADDSHCAVSEDSYAWTVSDDEGDRFFEGTFAAGENYIAEFLLMSDFGYWLDEATVVTVNGGELVESYGALALYVRISTRTAALLGDADDDGSVNILDATAIQRVLASYTVGSFDPAAANVSGNGLSILDATYIRRYIADYSVPYPIGQAMR